MCAQSIPKDAQLYRAKDLSKFWNEVPRHGSVAWLHEKEVWVELRYWNEKDHQREWITVDEYRLRTAQIKQANIDFYRTHPAEKARKIDGKRKGPRLFREMYPGLAGWACHC